MGEGDHIVWPREAQVDPGAELGLSTELSVDRVREPGDRGQREHGLGAETPWSFVDDDETRSGQAQYKNTFEDHLHSPHREDEKNGPCSLSDRFVTFVFLVQYFPVWTKH